MGQKLVLPLVMHFFQKMKNAPKWFKTVPKWTKIDKTGKNQEKKIRKNDPRVQLRLEKWSFFVIC